MSEKQSSDSCKSCIKVLTSMLMEKKDDFIKGWQVEQETFQRLRLISVHSRHKPHCRIYACDFCGQARGHSLGDQ